MIGNKAFILHPDVIAISQAVNRIETPSGNGGQMKERRVIIPLFQPGHSRLLQPKSFLLEQDGAVFGSETFLQQEHTMGVSIAKGSLNPRDPTQQPSFARKDIPKSISILNSSIILKGIDFFRNILANPALRN